VINMLVNVSEVIMFKLSTQHTLSTSLLMFAMFLSGCSNKFNTEFHSDKLNNLSARVDLVLNSSSDIPEQTPGVVLLDELIDVPELSEFIQIALLENPELQQSIQALKITQLQSKVVNAQRKPTANLDFIGSKTENETSNAYSTELTVSWELDLLGRLADQENAAKLDIASEEQSVAQVSNLLVSNIMRAWLDITLQKLLLDTEYARLANQKKVVDLIASRYSAGLDSLESLDNARARFFRTQANIENQSQQKYIAKQALAAFGGVFRQDITIDEAKLVFPLVIEPTTILSIQHVYERPDVKIGLLSIEAEALRTDAAYKALLPTFSISASLNDSDSSPIASLLTDPVWQLLGQLSAPLFQGGRLQAEAKSAELRLAQQVWKYQDTLLKAVREVETSIANEQRLLAQIQHLTNAISSAQRSYTSFIEKYQQGLVDIFDLLNTQEQTFDLQIQLTQTKHSQLTNRINLGLALGLGVN